MKYEDVVAKLLEDNIINEMIEKAMLKAHRKNYLPEHLKNLEGVDTSLPIGLGQTISQPTVVGHMLSLLNVNTTQKVLEIGTGSGWVAAVLSYLAKEVMTVDRIPEHYTTAKQRLKKHDNVKVLLGDGSCGWPEFEPYDRILISAAVPEIHEKILNQLTNDGLVVAPVGPLHYQMITKMYKNNNKIKTIETMPVVFVPVIGKCGYRR